MSKDKYLLVIIWAVTVGLLFKYIPNNKLRQGILAFLYKQVITWIFGLIVAEKGMIKYPVRLFEKVNKTSFSFEYFLFPAFSAIFNVHYPENKNTFIKISYYLFHTSLITGIEVIAERYTNLIRYVRWKWYWSFITIAFSYYSSRVFYRWYFNNEATAETREL